MTYEELLELEEKIGQVSRGLPKDLLDKLEKRKIVVNTEDMCTVCFSTFEVGDTATTLFRCSHSFHYDCLATWLQKEKKCPVCKQ